MKTLSKITLLLIAFLSMSFALKSTSQDPWDIPAKYKSMKNPTDASDKEGVLDGKYIYAKQCASCHGKSGMGDGSKAEDLEGYLGDFSDPEFFEEQTDGELFYKISKGRGDMPTFEKKIKSTEDIWLVINYIKTLAD